MPEVLRQDLEATGRKSYDVVAITHLDKDHYAGASEFFYLEHAKKYQDEDRVKIDSLWVPAAVIVEQGPEDPEARIIQAEARHRLLEGEGIRVFSRPDMLKDWLREHDLSVEDRAHLITDAGQLVPEFTKSKDGAEFFVHSPFARRLDDSRVVDRNTNSIVVQATFKCGATETKAILSADADHETLTAIVEVTRYNKNEHCLQWDIFKLPHHCSYLALGPDKGKDKTAPVPEVQWLFEDQGRKGGVIVSPSWPIPSTDEVDPPHRQAGAYYRQTADQLDGEFKVTMEHPKISAPAPLVILICEFGATIEKQVVPAATVITGRQAPRAG
ncbi:MAG: hypothetical protein WBF66_07270 [Dehalococcoidia bacterium]